MVKGDSISKNFKLGDPIRLIEELDTLWDEKRSAYVRRCYRWYIVPASVILHQQAAYLLHLIRHKHIYKIERK